MLFRSSPLAGALVVGGESCVGWQGRQKTRQLDCRGKLEHQLPPGELYLGIYPRQLHTPRTSTMASFTESSYSIVHMDNTADQPSVQQLQQQLEKGSDESKQDTMRIILTVMLNGDPLPQLLMHIIRFVMPSKNKGLKKLLYFYYEICPKHDANGKLKQEMILVW